MQKMKNSAHPRTGRTGFFAEQRGADFAPQVRETGKPVKVNNNFATTQTPVNREAAFFLQKLAKYNARPKYFKHCSGIQNCFSFPSFSIDSSSVETSKASTNRRRNTVPFKQKCHYSGALRQKRVLPQNVLSPQEKRGLSPSVRHKPSQHIYRDGSFQDGKFIHPEIPLKQGRLYDKHRLDRRLPVCTNSSNISTISSVQVTGEVLSIHNNAIRAKCSPAHIHETLETGCCLASRSRNTVGNLLGRSINNSFLERNPQSPQTIDNRSSRIFGIFNKLRANTC